MQVQRLAGSNKIAWWIRDILSRRRGNRPQHVSEFPAARVHLRRFSRQAQADTAAAMGTRKTGKPGVHAAPAPPAGPLAEPRCQLACRGSPSRHPKPPMVRSGLAT